METVIPEEEFDENPTEATRSKRLDKHELNQEQIRKDDSSARSMSYYRTSGKSTFTRCYLHNNFCCLSLINPTIGVVESLFSF